MRNLGGREREREREGERSRRQRKERKKKATLCFSVFLLLHLKARPECPLSPAASFSSSRRVRPCPEPLQMLFDSSLSLFWGRDARERVRPGKRKRVPLFAVFRSLSTLSPFSLSPFLILRWIAICVFIVNTEGSKTE